ncbi:Ig-like domain-containing protein, partial [Bradyrhizobium sp. S69]|uniref:Ig-like domain-containing protein n=1 Tax=Bradyrhizobium sp. S69 TaxID=1641856 RepID=UPI001AED50E6
MIIANDEAGFSTTATLNLTFSGNTIGAVAGTHNASTTDGFGSAAGIGLWVEFNGGTMNAMVANNYIYEFATNGIELQGGLATTGNETGTLNATMIGNTIEDPSTSAASKGALQVGIYVEPGPNDGGAITNSYAFNLTIGGSVGNQQNTISVPQTAISAANADDIELTQDGDTHSPFAINLTAETATAGTLSTYSGPGNDSGQAVETFLANNNNTPGNTGGYFALAVTGTGYGGGLPTATAPTSGPTFGTPTINGTDTEGSTLSVSVLGASYQWQEAFSNGEWIDISGANSSSFTLTEAQVGATLRVVETSVYSGGLIDTVASAATATVADHLTVTTPSITGTDTVGQILTASTPTVDNSDATVTYQWEENSGSGFVAISGATGQSYRLAAGDVGDTLEVVVTATDPHGGNVSATSGATGTIAAFTAQSFSSVTLGTLPGNDAVTITGKFTVNAQSDQLIVKPTFTGSISGSNFTTVSANGTVSLDSLTLGGEIFNDANGNGVLNAGESGTAGVSVSVFAAGGSTALETTTTNAFGIYDFTGLAAGNYFVEINASNFTGGGALANYSNSSPVRDTTPNDYAGGKNYGKALTGGVIDTNAITIAYDTPHPSGAGVDTTQTLYIGMIADPVIGAAGNTVQFYQSQGSTGTPLDSAITVTDATNITSATVTITAGYQSGDTLSFNGGATTETFGDGSTITATQSGGVLTLTTTSGNATAADYQTALESVKYDFTGDPTIAGTDATRTVAWSVTDTSGGTSAAGSTTTLDAFASPIVTVGAYTPPTVTASSGAVLADPSLGVTDYNGTTIAGATVAISAGAQAGDTLTIGGLTSGNIGAITYSFSGTTLTLTGSDTVADYKTVLDEVKFDATNPNNGTRTLTWQVNDNAGGHANDSVAVTTTANASFGPQITSVVGQPVNGGTVELDGTGVTVGDTINLYADGNIAVIVGTGTVRADGTFDITTTKTYADGVHDFTAAETNASNPTIPLAPEFAVDVNPNAPAITAVVGQPVNGGTVDLQGTGEVGETVNLYADGGTTIIGTGTVGAGGTFDITTTATFADGVHSFTAKEVDTASLTSTASTPAFTVDVDPNAPAITAVVGQPVNGGTVDLQGTGEVGDTVNLYADGGTTIIGTGTVGAGGTFDITTTQTFNDGVHTFTAKETDTASLTSTASTPAFTVDVNPSAPAITAVVGQPVNGGTVDLQGTGEVGDTVNLYADGGTTIVGTGIVGAGGTFDITTTATYADGVHTFTAKETDAASLTSTASTPAFTVDVNPNAPAITAVVGQPVNGGTVDLQGTGEVGDTVNLYADGGTTIVGTGLVGAGGTFDITTTATFNDGVHTFTAKEVDTASLTSTASTPAFTVDVNPSAPAITAVVGQLINGGTVELQGTGEVGETVNLYADGGATIVGSGTVGAGGTFDITTTQTFNDGVHTFTAKETDAASLSSTASTPAFTVDVNPNAPAITAVVGQPVNGGTVDLQGTGEAGETVNLYADGGATIVGTGVVGAGGTFDITTTATFADGVHTFTAKEVDAASLTSAASTPAFTVDVDPSAPAITAVVGQPVNGGTVELQGTGEVGDTVNLYADGGTTIVGTGVVGAGGTFDITTTATYADGVHTFTAKEVDAASLTSTASTPAFTVDVNPSAPEITAVVGQPLNGGRVDLQGTGEVGDTVNLYADGGTTIVGTGIVGAGGTFDITTTATYADGVHTFTAKETDAASLTSTASTPAFTVDVDPTAPAITAVVGQPVNGGTVELQGTGEAGETVNLYADGGTTIVGTGIVGAGGTFDITTTATYADGVHTFTAKEVDAASLSSTASTPAFTVDVNPNAPAITAVVGTPVNGGTVELQGTGEAGETVNLYADGGTTIVGTGVVGAGGTFDITTTQTFADGTHSFTAKEVDAASLSSTASTPAFTVGVESVAPTGLAQQGTATNGGPIEITGTGDAVGDLITLYQGGVAVGTGTVGAGDKFDITTTKTFTDGSYTLTATDKSVDGTQTSAMSAPVTAYVNPDAPAITAVVGQPVNGGTVELQGTGEVGDTVNLYADGGTTVVGTGVVGAGGTFDITTTATFNDGVHSFTAKETDAASLTSPASTPAFTVDVDPSAPAITAVVGQPVNGGTVELQGTGEAGDTVNLYADGGTTIVGTGTVGAGGKFDITTTAPFNDGVHTFTAKEIDAASLTSTASTPAFTVDVNPSAPTGLAVVGQPVNGQTVTVTGSGEAGDTVTLYNGATIVGTGTVGAGGMFSVTTTSALHDGAYSFTATETDSAKLTSAASSLTVDVNPSAPVITTLVEVVIGGKVDLQGTGEAGETVKLYADGNTTTVVGTGTVDGSGHFEITTTASFATGLHTFTATETDTAGLTSLPSNTAFAVNVNLFTPQHVFTDNSTPPSLPNVTLASLVGDVPRGPLLPVGDGIGTGAGGGFSFNVVHTDPVLATASDANVQINLALASLEAPLGGDVVYVEARQADGTPLPDWLKFDPATGTFAG